MSYKNHSWYFSHSPIIFVSPPGFLNSVSLQFIVRVTILLLIVYSPFVLPACYTNGDVMNCTQIDILALWELPE
jgi:hypothetical protein